MSQNELCRDARKALPSGARSHADGTRRRRKPSECGPVVGVGAGTTDRHAVEQALSQLAGAGARVVGAVLNDSRGEVERYGNNDYYGYPSSYAKSKTSA